jgi:type VI protein secretion system component Hcp
MARIKIKDLPRDQKINRNEMRKVFGGAEFAPFSAVKNIDETTPDLLQPCCTGSNIPDVNIHIFRAGGDEGGGSLSAVPPTSLTLPTYKKK